MSFNFSRNFCCAGSFSNVRVSEDSAGRSGLLSFGAGIVLVAALLGVGEVVGAVVGAVVVTVFSGARIGANVGIG